MYVRLFEQEDSLERASIKFQTCLDKRDSQCIAEYAKGGSYEAVGLTKPQFAKLIQNTLFDSNQNLQVDYMSDPSGNAAGFKLSFDGTVPPTSFVLKYGTEGVYVADLVNKVILLRIYQKASELEPSSKKGNWLLPYIAVAGRELEKEHGVRALCDENYSRHLPVTWREVEMKAADFLKRRQAEPNLYYDQTNMVEKFVRELP